MGYAALVDVHLILVRDGTVLLGERLNTGFADGELNLPSGKLEPGEDVRTAVIREAHEEIGLTLLPGDVRLACVVHYRIAGHEPRVGCFFTADRWDGEPFNAEPHKCAGLLWADLADLPPNTVEYCELGIRAFEAGRTFVAFGWDDEQGSDPARWESRSQTDIQK